MLFLSPNRLVPEGCLPEGCFPGGWRVLSRAEVLARPKKGCCPGLVVLPDAGRVLLLSSFSCPKVGAYPRERNREAADWWLSGAGGTPGGRVRVPANRNVCEAAREGLSGDGRTRACSTMMSRAVVGGLKGGRWAVRPLPPTVSLQPHAVARCAGPLPLLFRRREERRDLI